jgi:hypothetical protein
MKWRSERGREDGDRTNREIDDLLSSIMGCMPVSMWYGRRKGNNYINSLLLKCVFLGKWTLQNGSTGSRQLELLKTSESTVAKAKKNWRSGL